MVIDPENPVVRTLLATGCKLRAEVHLKKSGVEVFTAWAFAPDPKRTLRGCGPTAELAWSDLAARHGVQFSE